MSVETTFIVLFVIAMAVAMGVRRLRLPYTAGLVLAGLLLGIAHLFQAPEFNKTLLFSVFLPGLIFEAAFHIDFQDLWRNRITISSLAVPGVIASTVLIAVALAPLVDALGIQHGFTWRDALVFGALISATDPVAVVSVFRKFGIPHRLSLLIEGESLLNDGTGIVFFTLSLGIFSGTVISPGAIALQFVSIVGMGAIIGVALGFAVSLVLRTVDDPMIEVSLTTIAAYGSFVAAESLGYSGVIATVAAGLLCGNYGARSGMSASTRVAAETFWDFMAFALNSLVFLLIGLEISVRDLLTAWMAIIAAYLIVNVVRGVVIHIAWRLIGLTRERFPWQWEMVLIWGGLRGALPMVLALAVPPNFPFRQEVIAMTFGVVTLTILLQGMTMLPLLRRLGIVVIDAGQRAYDLRRAELQTAIAGLEELNRLEALHSFAPGALEKLRAEYEQRLAQIRDRLGKLTDEVGHVQDREIYQARQHLLLVEKTRVVDAFNQGLLAPSVHQQLLADIDARILQLQSNTPEEKPEPRQEDARQPRPPP